MSLTITNFKIQISGNEDEGYEATFISPVPDFEVEGEGSDELSAIRDLFDSIWAHINKLNQEKNWPRYNDMNKKFHKKYIRRSNTKPPGVL